jgi:protein-L-isoaspartate(D-aspartate) O-methyltransferase
LGLTKVLSSKRSVSFADEIDRAYPLTPSIKEAFSQIDREAFIPIGFKHFAYRLDSLPIAASQWISSPLTVAKMTTALEPHSTNDSVLEIGCGSGYQAAILSKLFRRVFTIERIEKLYRESKERFSRLGLDNINLKLDDGNNGWSLYAPYDRILFSASAELIPDQLFDQLRYGGILVAPMEQNGKQTITQFTKRKRITHKVIEDCKFVPVLQGVQRL